MPLIKECPHCRTAAPADAPTCEACDRTFRYIAPREVPAYLQATSMPWFFALLALMSAAQGGLLVLVVRRLVHL